MSFTTRQTGHGGKALSQITDATGAHFIAVVDHLAPERIKFYGSFNDLIANSEASTPPVMPVYESEAGRTRADFIQTLSPVSGPWETLRAGLGPMFSSKTHPAEINRPAAVARHPVTGELVLGSYYRAPTEVSTVNGTVTRVLPIAYQAPSTSVGGHAYTLSIAYSPSGQKIALGSTSRDVVNVYDTATGELLSRVGVPGSAGDPTAGKLNNVYGDCLFLDERTLAVPSYNGNAPGTLKAGWGSVSTWNIRNATATLKDTVMWPSSAAVNAVGSNDIRRPMDIIQDPVNPDRAWVASYGSAQIVQVDTTAVPWVITDSVTSPPGATIANPYGFDISPDGTQMVVAPHTNDIVVIDLASRTVAATISKSMYGLTGDWRDVAFAGDDAILVCDWAAVAAVYIPRFASYDIPFSPLNLPQGRRVERLAYGAPGGLDITNPASPILQTPAAALSRVGPVDVLLTEA